MKWTRLFDLIGGRRLPEEDDGPAHRYQLMIGATLASALCAAMYGLAAGSTSTWLALSDVYKMPMVLILSALAAVPATLLAWKLFDAQHESSDILMGLATGNFTASLVLAVSAPIVALYYHTSGYLGGTIALCAAGLSVIVGVASGLRSVSWRVPEGVNPARYLVPVAVMTIFQLAVLVQLIHVASPILPEVTVFDGGMDAILE